MERVHGPNWMQTAIPRFSELIEPLYSLLESQYSMHKTRVKSEIRSRPLSPWEASKKLPLHPSFRRSLSKSHWQHRTLRNAYASSRMQLRRIRLAYALKFTPLKLHVHLAASRMDSFSRHFRIWLIPQNLIALDDS